MSGGTLIDPVVLVDELIGRAEWASITAINHIARKIYDESQLQVPRSQNHAEDRPAPYPDVPLAENSGIEEATPQDPTAQIWYSGVYAAAQHEGHMEYRNPRGNNIEVEWVVEAYTTPGTKSKYLEDPLKMFIPAMTEETAIAGRIAFGELPGFIGNPASLQNAGRQEMAKPAPTGPIASEMEMEQVKVDESSATSLITPPGSEL